MNLSPGHSSRASDCSGTTGLLGERRVAALIPAEALVLSGYRHRSPRDALPQLIVDQTGLAHGLVRNKLERNACPRHSEGAAQALDLIASTQATARAYLHLLRRDQRCEADREYSPDASFNGAAKINALDETLSSFEKSGDQFHADVCHDDGDDVVANSEVVARMSAICRGITHQMAALMSHLSDADPARADHHLTGRNSPITTTPRHLFAGGSKPPERTSTDAHLHEPRPFASMAKLGFFPPDGIFWSRRKTARHAAFRQFLAQQKSLA